MSTQPDSEADMGYLKAPELLSKIEGRSARVGVVGIGYVGLPMMVAAAECGFTVTGIDVSESRVSQVSSGNSYIEDVPDLVLGPLVKTGKISATLDYSVVGQLDIVVVCVPTPVTKNKEPDLTPLEAAISSLTPHLRRDQLIVLQSTTFPGTTEEVVLPKIEDLGFQAGKDFYLAFAPERIDPGNKQFSIRNVTKVVGGVTPVCTQMASAFFSAFVEDVKTVSSPKIAEMTKLLENIFRSVNIALVNELAMFCNRVDIDIWEVIEATSTKPFGFMPFYPGPGVGGHCVPVDPFYLAWKAKEQDFYVNFIQLAAEINENMPRYVVSRIMDALSDLGKPLKGAKLLAVGVAFKENVSDFRNSPAVRVIELLAERGAQVAFSDCHVPAIYVSGHNMESVALSANMLQTYDAVVILANHSGCDLEEIVENSQVVIDTRNATGALGSFANVIKL
jgi:UDP-N-acetyl-D-glucosamine dehydrogenase